MDDQIKAAMRARREKKYGSPEINQAATGMAWQGILENHYQMKFPHAIPGHVVALMMAALKLVRAAAPGQFSQDSYDDAKVYTEIAEQVDSRKRRLKPIE